MIERRHSLNGELTDTGVYAGTTAVAGTVARSENLPTAPESGDEGLDVPGLAIVDADDVADTSWQMRTTHAEVERVIPATGGLGGRRAEEAALAAYAGPELDRHCAEAFDPSFSGQ